MGIKKRNHCEVLAGGGAKKYIILRFCEYLEVQFSFLPVKGAVLARIKNKWESSLGWREGRHVHGSAHNGETARWRMEDKSGAKGKFEWHSRHGRYCYSSRCLPRLDKTRKCARKILTATCLDYTTEINQSVRRGWKGRRAWLTHILEAFGCVGVWKSMRLSNSGMFVTEPDTMGCVVYSSVVYGVGEQVYEEIGFKV